MKDSKIFRLKKDIEADNESLSKENEQLKKETLEKSRILLDLANKVPKDYKTSVRAVAVKGMSFVETNKIAEKPLTRGEFDSSKKRNDQVYRILRVSTNEDKPAY
ncbi:MAG: hypothetical protein EZS28_018360 [Streblomastix strix]|uniref:Uncharacterized protein n=1 Tax=Streblomastix strix TaxID=222440 RepID=A0A5J4VUR6_9EUKA|nr:MAG: hypothetical protein EZS28_018360 [Streblomastix strix]